MPDFRRRLLIAPRGHQTSQDYGRHEDDHRDAPIKGLLLHTTSPSTWSAMQRGLCAAERQLEQPTEPRLA